MIPSLLLIQNHLTFIDNPDIASIPQTSEEYCRECKNIEPSQLKHILSPLSLLPLQEEMMSHHYRLHHTLFPKLVTMAEQGEIPKRLAALKGHCPVVKLISVNGNLNLSRSIQFASQLMMHQGKRRHLIRWYLLNLD
jgi:hypothetical protein